MKIELPGKVPAWIMLVGVGAISLLIYQAKKKGAAGVGAAVGGAVIDASTGVVTGVVKGIGGVFGIPDTDAEKCKAAIDAGEKFEASKYCTVPELAGAAWSGAKRLVGVKQKQSTKTEKKIENPQRQTGSILDGPSFEGCANDWTGCGQVVMPLTNDFSSDVLR